MTFAHEKKSFKEKISVLLQIGNTIESCRDHCKRNWRCQTFTFAPRGGDQNHRGDVVCTIYNSVHPTNLWGPNQIMCKLLRSVCKLANINN